MDDKEDYIALLFPSEVRDLGQANLDSLKNDRDVFYDQAYKLDEQVLNLDLLLALRGISANHTEAAEQLAAVMFHYRQFMVEIEDIVPPDLYQDARAVDSFIKSYTRKVAKYLS